MLPLVIFHSNHPHVIALSDPNSLPPLRTPHTIRLRGEMVLLGTGTSVGVPSIGCGCDVCLSTNPKNCRTRCAAVLGLPEGHLLIDTPPDLRQQLLREGIGVVETLIFTHEHADHVFGLDDARLFPFYLGHPIPVYCEPQVEARIRCNFDYAFTTHAPTHVGAAPQLDLRELSLQPLTILGTEVVPIRLMHGPRFEVLGFRVGNVAYCTDTNDIPPESQAKLQGLDVLILDALRPNPHPTHFSLDEAVEMAQKLGARRTIFTHISHSLEHEATNTYLPANMELGYDGMRIPLT